MTFKLSFGLPFAILLLASLGAAEAQTAPSRLSGDWRSSGAAVISSSKAHLQAAESDLGAAPSGLQLNRMLLLLAPSTAQQQALTTELAALQNPSSPSYHQWLTPSTFADAYANSASDVAQVVAWLQSEGFQVAPLPAGRGWIEFSGTVDQVEQAFQIKIESIATSDGARSVLTSNLTVPAAFSPLIGGLVSLDGSLATPALTRLQPLTVSAAEIATETSLANLQALTPQAAAQLLHYDTLQSSGIDGKGQTIAIAARSNINLADVSSFRTSFGLSAAAPQVVLNGSDPGLTADQAEATLAASWTGAAAPGASIVLVPAATTSATDGLDLSLAAIVDQDLAHTIALGFSDCEAGLSSAHQAFYSALFQQAAAEGIAIISAAGDSGSAACHLAGSTTPVNTGYAVNALASTPWDTAVGVASYGASGPGAGTTALSAWSPFAATDPSYASGGGNSALFAGPGWQPVPASAAKQASLTGLASGKRLLPDVSLPTALDSGANRGLAFCFSGSSSSAGCDLQRAGGSAAAASLFAGVAALVDEQHGAEGNLAPGLYALSNQSGAYADVAQGSAQLACTSGSSGCGSNGQIGYTASSGYDLATGLGVPNAATVVEDFAQPEVNGTQTASVNLAVTPAEPNSTYNPSASVTVTATVLSQSGGSAPTGTVTFYNSTTGNPSPPETIDTITGVASVSLDGGFQLGGNEMVAEYSGDNNYAAVNSTPPVNVNIQASTTSLVVQPSTSSITPGQTISIIVTLTVGSPPAGTVNPAGVITLNLDGGAEVYTAPLVTSSGVTTATFASVTIPANSVLTTHTLQAVYNGNTDYAQSTSPQVSLTVTASMPTVTLTPATTTPTPGSSLLLTAAVSPPISGETPPTGIVTFTLDGSAVGSATLAPQAPSSLGALTITAPTTIGNHTLQVSYGGDGFYNAVTSAQITIDVTARSTTTTVNPATTTPALGSTLPVTATVSPSVVGSTQPTGTITFTVDGVTTAVQAVTPGSPSSSSVTLPALSPGTHTLAAIYSGDSYYASSTAPGVAITVPKSPTAITITPAATSLIGGGVLGVSAIITATTLGTSYPSGTVTFTIDGASAGTAAVVPGVPATASANLSSITPGTHVLAATYSGDSYYGSTTSSAITITVSKSPTTISIIPSTLTPTAGGSMIVTADITSANPSTTYPSGTVTIDVDGVAAATASVTAGSPSIAAITLPLVSAGTHVLEGVYSGDTYYTGSNSTTVDYTAAKGATTTTLAATPATLTANTDETLTATVAPVNAVTGVTYTITGTVSFYDGTTLLGQVAAVNGIATLSNVALKDNLSHSLTAVYSGDTNWVGSTSSALPLAASTLPDYVVLTSNFTTAQPGATVVLTATVTPASTPLTTSEANPTGLVIFYNGTTVIGQSALTPVALTDTSTATLTIQTLPGGTDTVSAYYQGDDYYDASTSNLLSLTIQAFSITPSSSNPPTNLNIVQGGAGSESFVITGEGGFNNEVQLVCAPLSQDNMTCTASPQQITPPGTVTFVVQTYKSGGSTSGSTVISQRGSPLGPRVAGGTALAFLLGFFLLPFDFGRRARRLLERYAGSSGRRLIILLLLLVGLGGAGIGCTSTNVNTTAVSGATPLGVATIKVTGSAYVDNAVVSQSVYFTVNVTAPQ